MGVSGNVSKASSIVAALCILVYIAAIAFGAVRIIVNTGERRDLAKTEFDDLADRASSSAVFLGFMSDAYQESLRDFIADSNSLLGVIITGSGGEYAFERQPGSGITWAGDSPRLKTGAGIAGEPFYMPLRVEGQRNVTLQAVYGIVDFRLVQSVLKDSLLAVLAALIAAFITLLVEVNFRNRSAIHKNDAAAGAVPPDTIISASTPAGNDAEFQAAIMPERSPDNAPLPRNSDIERASTGNASGSKAAGSPQGLYTPRGNIGWESYTRDRLASELHRCASFEQDLTFLIMEFPEPTAYYRQLADEAVSFFFLRDLIFEHGENGIAVILPNAGLDQAITKCEEFRGKIVERLPESFEERTELCIGLSSRSGRLIEADRIMREASSALEKALSDNVSYVVAFKSDPEKYRDFIKQSGRNA